jgi:hypothetical protein
MSQRVIYRNGEGGIAVMFPSENCLAKHTIQEIAEKDVPAGLPYKIISADEIPFDFTFMGAWEVDEADLTDGVGGEHDMFIIDPQHPDYVVPMEGEVIDDQG